MVNGNLQELAPSNGDCRQKEYLVRTEAELLAAQAALTEEIDGIRGRLNNPAFAHVEAPLDSTTEELTAPAGVNRTLTRENSHRAKLVARLLDRARQPMDRSASKKRKDRSAMRTEAMSARDLLPSYGTNGEPTSFEAPDEVPDENDRLLELFDEEITLETK